ncbi:MAG: NAD synthetase [Candidatus Rokubacteria bacterium GWC2_70_24]|nr:MAG: NAD synthetase [Candidatus Rokubacteria bacterium GWA2_70_23]OGK90446.1 MAG: NAD synthetase [Candidatus Rokubacteria bacterium GWF2_70_14]OGK93666.1 MAG: NAD synthetase [Candidatus Rokubacteria bacterium GWC2_70_24]
MRLALVNLAYLLASVLFILTFKGLAHPRTAVRANLMGSVGMLVAVIATLTLLDWSQGVGRLWVIPAGLGVGSVVGALLALRIRMTAVPQMVALLNGFGGAASTLVAGAALLEELAQGRLPDAQLAVATVAAAIIGAVTFWGSLVAFGKLEELIHGRPLLFAGQHVLNAGLLGLALLLGAALGLAPGAAWTFWVIVAAASVLGVTLVLPIGGADMPVVICLLNSYSGLAACATGFVLQNNMLIVAGSLVGASGLILTGIMCRAMNRSLANVVFGGVGAEVVTGAAADQVYGGRVKSASAEEIAIVLETARRVVIVPGYGMAVSQAQHAVRDLARLLESRGTEVEFGVHPVAGRMPGHMNVLLAEADIPYDKVREMAEVNPSFAQTDVAIVIGANDVVNPVARTDPKSPIAGMPILDVDKAKTVVVIKRSLSPGFAGIPNPLFAADNTLMYFADGKKAVLDLVDALKRVG